MKHGQLLELGKASEITAGCPTATPAAGTAVGADAAVGDDAGALGAAFTVVSGKNFQESVQAQAGRRGVFGQTQAVRGRWGGVRVLHHVHCTCSS